MENTRAGTVWIWLAYLLIYPAVAIALVVYLGALASQILPGSILFIPDASNLVWVTLGTLDVIAMNIALYVVVTLVTLGLSANSIAREKQGKTWDALLLTGVDARHLVWGKWWATVRTLWKDYALVGMLRLGMVAWLIAATSSEFFFRPFLPGLSAGMAYLLVGGLVAVLYTVLDAMLTAALGLVAALADFRTGIAAVGALIIRVVMLFAPLAIPPLVFTQLEVHEASFYLEFWMVCLAINAGLVWLLLRGGQALAVRQQALPPAEKE